MPAAIAIPALATLAAGGVAAGASIYGARANSAAARAAARYQRDSANYASELEAQAADKALQFAREQEAQRRKEYYKTEERNFQLREPFRQFSLGALAQAGKPIYQPGGLAGLIKR